MARAQSGMNGVVGVVIAVTIAAVIGVTVGIGVIGDVVGDNSGTVTVTNESATAQLNEAVDLEGYEVQEGTVVIYDSDGNEVPSSNYTIDSGTGAFTLTDTAEAADGEAVTVTYDYQATDGTTSTILDLLTMFVALIILVFVARPLMSLR